MKIWTFTVCILTFSAFSNGAIAETAKAKQVPGSVALKTLLFGENWGANRANMLSVIKDQFDSAWRAKASELDAYEVDVEIRKSQRRYEDVVNSYVELDQNSSAYLASPLRGEFGQGLGQSLLRVQLQHGDRYFLFQSARLAKIVDIVPSSRFKSLAAFGSYYAKKLQMETVRTCEGKLVKTKNPHAFLACAIDKSRLFSAYVLTVVDPSIQWKLSDESAKTIDDEIGLPDIFSEDPDSEDELDLVDELTGSKKKASETKSRQSVQKKAKQEPKAVKPLRKDEKGLSQDEDVLY